MSLAEDGLVRITIGMTMFETVHTQASCFDDKGNLWLFSNEMNALFKIPKGSRQMLYVCSFQEKMFVTSLYTSMKCVNGKLLLTPCSAKNFVVYDIHSAEAEYYPIEKPARIYFNTALLSDSVLVMFPVAFFEFAYVYDSETEVFSKVRIHYPEFIGQKLKNNFPLFVGEADLGGLAAFCVCKTDMYLKFNPLTGDTSISSIPGNGEYYKMAGKGSCLFFLNMAGDELLCLENGAAKSLGLETKTRQDVFSNGIPMGYGNLVMIGRRVYCIPFKGNPIYIFAEPGHILLRWNIDWKQVGADTDTQPIVNVNVWDEKSYFLPYQGPVAISIDSPQEPPEKIIFSVADAGKEKFASRIFDSHHGEMVFESKSISARYFLQYVRYAQNEPAYGEAR